MAKILLVDDDNELLSVVFGQAKRANKKTKCYVGLPDGNGLCANRCNQCTLCITPLRVLDLAS